jgi:hypothetical protein
MDQKSKEQLDEILRKEPAALTPGDVDVLKARISYLSPSDIERYKPVLAEEKSVEKPAPEKPSKSK